MQFLIVFSHSHYQFWSQCVPLNSVRRTLSIQNCRSIGFIANIMHNYVKFTNVDFKFNNSVWELLVTRATKGSLSSAKISHNLFPELIELPGHRTCLSCWLVSFIPQVQLRHWQCGQAVSCVCGVAARENDVILVADMCKDSRLHFITYNDTLRKGAGIKTDDNGRVFEASERIHVRLFNEAFISKMITCVFLGKWNTACRPT